MFLLFVFQKVGGVEACLLGIYNLVSAEVTIFVSEFIMAKVFWHLFMKKKLGCARNAAVAHFATLCDSVARVAATWNKLS